GFRHIACLVPLPPPPAPPLFPYTTLFRSFRRTAMQTYCASLLKMRPLDGGAWFHFAGEAHFGERSDLAARQPALVAAAISDRRRSEEHTSELQSRGHLVCRLLLEKTKSIA